MDLLDNYMKNCIDKKIIPYGGVLHLVYDEAWNPPGQFSVDATVCMYVTVIQWNSSIRTPLN